MSLAPVPGAGRRAEAAASAAEILTITVRGESHTLALNNIPLAECRAFRKATGLPIEGLFTAVGMDTVASIWWLARRMDGEQTLTLEQCDEEWPADLKPDEIDISVGDPEGDDPEA